MEEFQIEKNAPPLPKRGKSMSNPNFFRIKATMQKMDKGDAFTYPLQASEKIWTIQSWVKIVTKNLNDAIVDTVTRSKNPYQFSNIVIKDLEGKKTGIKIRRDN